MIDLVVSILFFIASIALVCLLHRKEKGKIKNGISQSTQGRSDQAD